MADITKQIDIKTDLRALFAEASTPEQLASVATTAALTMQQTARDLRSLKVRSLGDGEAFVRLGPDGKTVRAAKVPVRLEESQGHVYRIPGGRDRPDTVKVSAEGYTYINSYAGVSLIKPPYITVDGEQRENPYMQTSPTDRNVLEAVHVRTVAVGRTVTGQIVATDYTLRFDPRNYLIEALKKTQGYGKCGDAIVDGKRSVFEAWEADSERQTDALVFLPYLSLGASDALGLCIDVTHPEVTKQLKTYQNLVQFAERRAQTICSRNALRHHPAIAVSTVKPDENGAVRLTVWGWAEDEDMHRETQRVQRAIMQGGLLPEEVTVQTAYADATPEDDETALIEEAEIVEETGISDEEKAEILAEERGQ